MKSCQCCSAENITQIDACLFVHSRKRKLQVQVALYVDNRNPKSLETLAAWRELQTSTEHVNLYHLCRT